jgi:type II secretory pathway component GspD/PulD (secretin)
MTRFQRKTILLLCCLLLVALPGLGAEQTRLFSLQHRSGASILQSVQALLRDGERVSAAGNQLLMIAAPETLDATAQLIALLDHPLKQFLVQLRWLDGVATSHNRLGFDGDSGMTTLPGGGTTLGTAQRQSGQQLLVLEGERAVVVTGRDIPYQGQWAAWSGSEGEGFAQTTDFQRVRSGFSIVIDSIRDKELQVQITPQLMRAQKGSEPNPALLTFDRLTSKVQLKPGEWVDLGGILADSSVGAQILSGANEPLAADLVLQLRIDEQN